MSEVVHPEWVAIGSTVEAVRSIGRSVAWRRQGVVTAQTKTTVTVEYERGSVDKFRQKGGRYLLTPAYLDYVTTITPV